LGRALGSGKGNIMGYYDDSECLEGPEGCRGETFPRLALSGSGESYPRCDHHYELYVERLQPIMDDRNFLGAQAPDFKSGVSPIPFVAGRSPALKVDVLGRRCTA